MDRISALRNVEEALAEFERGDCDLDALERRVQTILRTYATEFGTDVKAAYRVAGEDDAVVVVADSPGTARERASDLADVSPTAVRRLSPPEE